MIKISQQWKDNFWSQSVEALSVREVVLYPAVSCCEGCWMRGSFSLSRGSRTCFSSSCFLLTFAPAVSSLLARLQNHIIAEIVHSTALQYFTLSDTFIMTHKLNYVLADIVLTTTGFEHFNTTANHVPAYRELLSGVV